MGILPYNCPRCIDNCLPVIHEPIDMIHFSMFGRLLAISGLGLLCLSTAVAANEDSFTHVVAPFLKSHCIDCHGAEEPAGERRLDQLSGTISDSNSLIELQDILDQLNLDAMPPAEAEQPPLDEQRKVIEWLTRHIADYHAQHSSNGGETVLRRLNAREYRNTVRDLLHLNMTMFDPTEGFPREQTAEHLDNVGATLVTSGYLLSKYLSAAEMVINKALLPLERPEVQSWSFHDRLRQQPEIDQVHGKTNNFEHLTLYDVVGADKHEGAYAPLHDFAQGVPYDGYYEIRFTASALHRLHPFDDDYLGTDRNELLRLGIVAGKKEAGPLHKPQPMEPLLAETELQDGSQPVSLRVWLDKGFTPRFTFRNGLFDARNLWSRTLKQYPDQFPKPQRPGIVEARYLAIKHGKFPQIQIDDIEIRGPLIESWPTASQRELLGEDWEQVVATGQLSNQQLHKHLTRFATRAFRRPVKETELEKLLALVALRRQAGRSGIEAFADGLKAILCSPSFLYVNDLSSQSTDEQKVDIVARLSESSRDAKSRLGESSESMPNLDSESRATMANLDSESRATMWRLRAMVCWMITHLQVDFRCCSGPRCPMKNCSSWPSEVSCVDQMCWPNKPSACCRTPSRRRLSAIS